jgi:4-hydroxy-3-methylbut-2-enyl diphosphate reductase
MFIETDKKSGFCFGVQNAVEIAEKALLEGEKVYSLGPIVHNDMEVERLSALGLTSINHEEFSLLSNCRVLIRAHGEPPETYAIAEQNDITIIEATCPIVRKLQSRIKVAWLRMKEVNGQVVIFGKKGHAEVVGLLGQIKNEGILISRLEELSLVDPKRPVSLFSQTTMSVPEYNKIASAILENIRDAGIPEPEKNLTVNRSICGQVSSREPHLRAFAARHDVIIFVSGQESSNGKMLYSICKSINNETHFVTSPEELEKRWFTGKRSAGICGATSTPKWLIEKIGDAISAIAREEG